MLYSAMLSLCMMQSADATEALQRLDGEHFDIVTVEAPPFVSVRQKPFNRSSSIREGAESWGGWGIDILKMLAKESGFTYTLHLNKDNTFSYKAGVEMVTKSNGTFDLYWGLM